MVGKDTYETVTLGFEEIVKNIKNSCKGTLIIITGRVGCGKTTMALKLLREINGYDDVDTFLITHGDVERTNEKRHKAYLSEGMMNDSFLINLVVNKLDSVLIRTVPDIYWIPRTYRMASEEGVGNICQISFDDTSRGKFTVKGYVRVAPHRYEPYKSFGQIMERDVTEISEIQKKWAEDALRRFL